MPKIGRSGSIYSLLRSHGRSLEQPPRGRSGRNLAPQPDQRDEEAPSAEARLFHKEARHAMHAVHAMLASSDDDDARLVIAHSSGEVAHLSNEMPEEDKAALITKARDEYFALKRNQFGNDFDEDRVMKRFAAKQLLQTDSNEDLMLTAEIVIEEDWLGNVDGLPGNVYRLAVMGDIFDVSLATTWGEMAKGLAKIMGVLTIVLIQICGPPLIFLSRILGWGILSEDAFRWECCPWLPSYSPESREVCYYADTAAGDVTKMDDWHHVASTKFLGIIVLLSFLLNGLFVLIQEKQSWKQIYNTCRYLDVMNDRFKMTGLVWLYCDALINTWVVVWCCMDIFLVMGESHTPSDVLMNALGLLFLFNLDDVGTDLGFVTIYDWPGERLAWIYKEMVKPCNDEIFDEDQLDLPGFLTVTMYNTTITMVLIMVVVLPMLAVITPFIQIAPPM